LDDVREEPFVATLEGTELPPPVLATFAGALDAADMKLETMTVTE
jgi:hypothetical protein